MGSELEAPVGSRLPKRQLFEIPAGSSIRACTVYFEMDRLHGCLRVVYLGIGVTMVEHA